MVLAFIVLLAAVWGFGVWCGRKWASARGLEMLGEAELRNRRRMTGL